MPKPKKSGGTTPRQFRLDDDVVEKLERIAEFYTQSTGRKHTRTDAVKIAVHREDERIHKRGK